MDRYEAARKLGLADADVLSVEPVESGTKVTVRDGGDRLVTDEGVFALSDHPATAQLRRHGVDEEAVEDVPVEDGEQDEEPSEPEGSEDVDGDGVPDGTAESVLAWVGDDPERARAALAAEDRREHPRSTLVDKLRKLAG